MTEVRTSQDYPLYVDWIETAMFLGKLGMTLAPGVKHMSTEGFLWDRDLNLDLETLKNVYEVGYLVTLMKDFEYEEYEMHDFFALVRDAGIEAIHFPIVDMQAPRTQDEKGFDALIFEIRDLLEKGKRVVVHCRGGLGRTGTVTSSVLVAIGLAADEAMSVASKARKADIPQTDDQKEYVREFARRQGIR